MRTTPHVRRRLMAAKDAFEAADRKNPDWNILGPHRAMVANLRTKQKKKDFQSLLDEVFAEPKWRGD